MSIDNFKGNAPWDTASSQNAGTFQAQQGQTSSAQQANENWAAFQQRQAAYDAEKRK